jgi:hypothetical protein
MELDDAVSIPFLQSHTRDPIPKKIVWEQADLPRAHFYWLAVDAQNRAKGSLLQASYDEDGIAIEKGGSAGWACGSRTPCSISKSP